MIGVLLFRKNFPWAFGGPTLARGRAEMTYLSHKEHFSDTGNNNGRPFLVKVGYVRDVCDVLHYYFGIQYPLDINGKTAIKLPPDFLIDDPRRASWWSGREGGDYEYTSASQLFKGGRYAVFRLTWSNYQDKWVAMIKKHR